MRRALVLALAATLSLVAVGACRGTQPAAAVADTGAPQPATAGGPAQFTGTVAETMNSGGYTYARLQAPGKDDVWIAASAVATKPGDRLTVTLDMPMQNFESKTLGRTFPVVYFVSAVSPAGQGGAASGGDGAIPALMTSHAPASVPTSVEPVAPAPGGMSIADVWAKRTELAGKQVTLRGKVVKLNEQILGVNWLHLQDGSGSADDRTNDLTITTGQTARVGDVITVTGVLAVGKDFGAGYRYDAIVENGKIAR